MIQELKAFHGDPAIKEKYITRVRAHAAVDRLIQGTGWDGGKGCAVGCTLEAYDHSRYPVELGLPEWLARMEDSIFEGLPAELAMTWPERFLSAIPVGANLEPVRHRLAIARFGRLIALQENNLGKFGEEVDAAIRGTIEAIKVVAACHEAELVADSCTIDWSAARSAAESAARSAESAAWSAESAARSAARSARSARSAAWITESETLLELLSQA